MKERKRGEKIYGLTKRELEKLWSTTFWTVYLIVIFGFLAFAVYTLRFITKILN